MYDESHVAAELQVQVESRSPSPLSRQQSEANESIPQSMSQPQSQPERIRVAVVGAGIVGLIFAVALNHFDTSKRYAIDIYEATPELNEIGAGINMWPKTYKIFQEIGLMDDIALFERSPDLEPRLTFEIRKADQKDGYKVVDLMTPGGALRIHRADFQRFLVDHLPLPTCSISSVPRNSQCTLHLSHRLIDYIDSSPPFPSHSSRSKSNPVILHFLNQPSRTADILIACDGIKSTTRKLFLEKMPNPEKYLKFMEPVWSGAVAYRGLIPREELESVYPGHRAFGHPGIMYMGKNKHAVVYPISSGRYINVVAAVHNLSEEGKPWECGRPWNTDVTQGEFLSQFEGWEEEFQALMKCIKHPTKWALQTMPHLDVYARGRVFLIGDAVHAMVPYIGAGAAVGIDDAHILASLLTSPSTISALSPTNITPSFLNHLTLTFNSDRVHHSISMIKASIHQGHLYTLQTPTFDDYQEGDRNIPIELLRANFKKAERQWAWVVNDPKEERRTILERFEQVSRGRGGEIRSMAKL